MRHRSLILVALTITTASVAACHHGGHRHGGPLAAAHHTPAAGPLTEAAIAIPIRAGKTDTWRAKLAELTGPRYDEYQASRTRYGLTSQTTYLQSTPMGDFALIHLTGPDVRASFHRMSSSQDPWDVTWREMTLDLHGLDFARDEARLPTVEPAFSTGDEVATETPPFLFVVPLDPSRVAEFWTIAAELNGPRRAAYADARHQLGVRREVAFLETSNLGAAVVFAWVADDPQASLRQLAASTEPFDRWLASATQQLHPVAPAALTATIAANQRVGQFPRD